MVNSFPPSHRLRSNDEIKQVFQNSKRLIANKVAAFSRVNNLCYPRLGVSISKKNVRRAVKRNYIKRVTRETFRHQQQQLGGLDIVVVAYKGADTLTKVELRQCLEELWRKLAALSKKG